MKGKSTDRALKFSEVARMLGRSTGWVKQHKHLFPNAFTTPHRGRIGGLEWRVPESDVAAVREKIQREHEQRMSAKAVR